VSGEAHVAAFLKALEGRFKPPPGQRHVLYAELLGSETAGYSDRLCLQIAMRVPMEAIVLDGDLAKPIEQLLQEVTETVHKAAEVKRRGREFDLATGG